MSNWLDDLDTLPDLRTKPKTTRKPKTTKAKGQAKHIKGETHPFISLSLEQFNQTRPLDQRGFGGDIIPPVFRRYLLRELKKAKYTPSHILGISPVWPEHLTINWSLA
jgi:hypothetical protein